MAGINPYLTFNGNCEEAFGFYKGVFGGEFLNVARFSEMPPDVPASEEDSDKIMHIALPLGEGQMLMGSDSPSSMPPASFGNNVHISVSPSTRDEAVAIFKGLSEGGQVAMPFETMFWGADFGMCADKFGVHWMVNWEHPKS